MAKISSRQQARRLALQALYQWQLSGGSCKAIITQFLIDNRYKKKLDTELFQKLTEGVIQNSETIDKQFIGFLDRALDALNPVELAAIRLGAYELIYCLDVPYRVVINEYLEVTKTFGSIEGFKYVNGVLDKVAKKTRKITPQTDKQNKKH